VFAVPELFTFTDATSNESVAGLSLAGACAEVKHSRSSMPVAEARSRPFMFYLDAVFDTGSAKMGRR
jgi:hypothetical protein